MKQEMINRIEEYLEIKGKEYLNLIKNTYSSFMSQDQIDFLDKLSNSKLVKVEENGDRLREVWQNENVDIPLAHGGRTFDDNIIHFYPIDYLEKMKEKDKKDIIINEDTMVDFFSKLCEKVLIHELLHFFIRPKYLKDSSLEKINSYTTEGLVDMITRDIQIKNNINLDYNSDYAPNVIFFRKILNNIPSYEDKMKLVFQGSVEQIFSETNSTIEEINNINIGKIADLINDISLLISSSYNHSQETVTRALYNAYANYDNEEDYLNFITFLTKKEFPINFEDVTNLINNYNSNFTI